MKLSGMRAAVAALAASLIFLGGCGASPIHFRSASIYDTAITIQVPPVTDINPLRSDSYANRLYDHLIFQTLVGINQSGQPTPELASSWISKDHGLIWHITLNPFAKWWTGRPVTAANVAWSLGYYQHQTARSPRSLELMKVAAIRVKSPTTLVIRLKRPDRDFVADVLSTRGALWILPSFLLDRVPFSRVPHSEYLNRLKDVVGDGPFRPIAQTRDSITWAAYPHYFMGSPRVKYLKWVWKGAARPLSSVDITWSASALKALSSNVDYRVFVKTSPILWILTRKAPCPLPLSILADSIHPQQLPGTPIQHSRISHDPALLASWLTHHGYRRTRHRWTNSQGQVLTIRLAVPYSPFAKGLAHHLAHQWQEEGFLVENASQGIPAGVSLNPLLSRPRLEKVPPQSLPLVLGRQYWYVKRNIRNFSPNVWEPFYHADLWRVRSSKKR